MDFQVVTMVVMLSLTTPVHGRILKREARATCTAPMATKGETAVVTCHYPQVVKQPGKTVAIDVEHYPDKSSNTDSKAPRTEHILECVWNEDEVFSCAKKNYTVEGKKVVITIKNVTEDSQGKYVCTMNVKDGNITQGDPCWLQVNGSTSSDQTTVSALDQQTTTDNDTISTVGIVIGCTVAVAVVVVVVVAVCVWKRRCRNRTASNSVDETVESGNGLLPQRDHAHPARSGAQGQGNNDDIDHGNGLLLERDHAHPAKSGALGQGNNDDIDHGNGLLPERDHAHPARSGALGQGNNDDIDQSQDTMDRPPSKVPQLVDFYNEIDGARQRGSVSTCRVRASKETKETEKTHGKEKKKDEENETGGRQESKQDEKKEKEGEENETKERQEEKQEKEKEGEEIEMEERQWEKQDEKEKEGEENETEERQEKKPNEDEKEDEENKTEEKKQDEEKKDEENEKYREDDDGENKGNEEEEVEDAVEREGGGAESVQLLGASYRHSS